MYRIYRLFLYSIFCILLYACSGTPVELNTAEQLMETAPDSALHILQQLNSHQLHSHPDKALYALLMSQALDRNDIKLVTDSIIKVATDYYTDTEPERAGYAWFYHSRTAHNRGNAEEQTHNLLTAQAFAQKSGNYKLQGLIFADKAILYESQHQYDSMIHYCRLSFHSFQHSTNKSNSVISLLKLGYGFLFLSRYDSAIVYYHMAEKLALPLHDSLLMSSVYRNLGSGFLQQGDFKEAMHYFSMVPLTHIGIYDSNKWYLMAKLYVKSGNPDSARFYLNKITDLHEIEPDYYRLWESIYEKEGKLREALYVANKITHVKDSMNNRNLKVSFAGMDKKYKYQALQLENQNLIIQNKQKGLSLLFVLFAGSIFVVMVLYWRLRTKKRAYDIQNELLEKEIALVEIEKVQIDKEKENSALLERQLKLHSIILLNIEQHRKNSIKRPRGLKNDLNEQDIAQNLNFFEELIACMDLEYANISERLIADFPALSQRDILICCLLLAGFDTGMIATILDLKIESVTKHRYRLRTKLRLQSADHLVGYLRQY